MVHEFIVYECSTCGKQLKPHCDMKEYKGKKYCIKCYLDKIYPKIRKMLKDLDNVKPEEKFPNADCLKIPSKDKWFA